MDINKLLGNLTAEQSKALAAQINPQFSKEKKAARTAKKAASKKTAAKKAPAKKTGK